MIYIGIDDTDILDTPGTNQLARALALRVAPHADCALIVRHQLLVDPRVPCTSKNGCASLVLRPRGAVALPRLIADLRTEMRERFTPGSDPGLCVTATVPDEVIAFGRTCQRCLVSQAQARLLARQHQLHLEGLGGTEDGVIGALAAVGLIATGDDGRVVQNGAWPDDCSGLQELAILHQRGVQVRELASGAAVAEGMVDVGKKLRPNYRQHQLVLYVQPLPQVPESAPCWQAVRLD